MNKLFLTLLLFCSAVALAQNTSRKFIASKATKSVLEISVSDGTYLIKPYSNHIVETTFLPKGEKFNPDSHAVVLEPEAKGTKYKETKSEISYSTSGIEVRVEKSPFKISYFFNDKLLLSEKNGYTKKDSTEILDFTIDNTEALYGGGARALGMNRRSNRLRLYNKAQYGYGDRAELLNFTIPMVLSSKIYAVHFDNTAIGYLDLDSKKDNTLAYETISGRKTYQVIAADSWLELIKNYTLLTGTQPLPPLWALGNLSSRFGYHSQAEVEKTIKKFQEDKIPVDAIILDLYWFGKTIQGTMGNLEWDKETFPNPTKMIADLNTKNIKTVLITEPFILTTSSKWKEAVDRKVLATDKFGKAFTYDFYFGNTGIVDIFTREGKDWFWNIYKNLANQGVQGWWGDLGEPEVFPSEAQTAKGSADEVHNIYGHSWAKLIADGYQKDFPDVRPFILMRSGYSGSQRYGMLPWSGDVSRSWSGLQSQPEIALEMGMQGIGYMHSDLGGFAGDYYDNELYIRWLQYGVFQPIFRPHADDAVAPEPVYKDIVTKAKAKKQVELRYQLLPYIYTLAFKNTASGEPLMRPLFFEEPQNSKLLNHSESYLWGNDFLVHPITKPGVTSESIYFPKADNWFDFHSDEKHAAGSTQTVSVSADHIPVFVRGNAFIPMIATIQNTASYSIKKFDLHFYFDATKSTGSGMLYNDDGKTPDATSKLESEIVYFTSVYKGNQLTLSLNNHVQKKFKAADKNITIIIHNVADVKNVSVKGKNITFNAANNRLEIPVTLEKGMAKDIKIEF